MKPALKGDKSERSLTNQHKGYKGIRRYTETTLTKIKSTNNILHNHKISYFNDILKGMKKRESDPSLKTEESQASRKKLSQQSSCMNFFSRKKAISNSSKNRGKQLSPYVSSKLRTVSKTSSPDNKSKKKKYTIDTLTSKFGKKNSAFTTTRYKTKRKSKGDFLTEKKSLKSDRSGFYEKYKAFQERSKKSLSRISSLTSRKNHFPTSSKNSNNLNIYTKDRLLGSLKRKSKENSKKGKHTIKKLIEITNISKDKSTYKAKNSLVNRRVEIKAKSRTLGKDDFERSYLKENNNELTLKIDQELEKLKNRISSIMERDNNLISMFKNKRSFQRRSKYKN